MNNFRQAILATCDQAPRLTTAQKAAMRKARAKQKPIRWHFLRAMVVDLYEQDTGLRMGASTSFGLRFDWMTLLDWLLEHLPQILAWIRELFE